MITNNSHFLTPFTKKILHSSYNMSSPSRMTKKSQKLILFGFITIVFIAGAVWWCKHHNKEGLTRRVPVANELLPFIYSTSMAESPYYQKWNYQLEPPTKEGYTDLYTCEKACENVLGATPHKECIDYCENATMIQNQLPPPVSCEKSACGPGQVCIRPGYYTNAPKACLNSLTPGVPVPASLNPALRPLYPPIKPDVPAWAPLTPAWAPINPVLTPLDPAMGHITPSWAPINPVASGVLAPLLPDPRQLKLAIDPLEPSWIPHDATLDPINPPYFKLTNNIAPELINKPTPPFQQKSCPIGQFYNHGTGKCENRFQF